MAVGRVSLVRGQGLQPALKEFQVVAKVQGYQAALKEFQVVAQTYRVAAQADQAAVVAKRQLAVVPLPGVAQMLVAILT
jgi:hypothetical protein